MSNSYRHGYSQPGAGEWRGRGAEGGSKRQRRTAESGDFWKHFYVCKHKLYSHLWFIYIYSIYILVHFPRSCSCCWRHIPLRRRFRQRFQFHQMQKKQQQQQQQHQLLLAPTSVKLSRGGRGAGAGVRKHGKGGLGRAAIGNRQPGKRRRIWLFCVDSISLAAFRLLLLLLLLLIGCCCCLCCCCHFAMQITRKAR